MTEQVKEKTNDERAMDDCWEIISAVIGDSGQRTVQRSKFIYRNDRGAACRSVSAAFNAMVLAESQNPNKAKMDVSFKLGTLWGMMLRDSAGYDTDLIKDVLGTEEAPAVDDPGEEHA